MCRAELWCSDTVALSTSKAGRVEAIASAATGPSSAFDAELLQHSVAMCLATEAAHVDVSLTRLVPCSPPRASSSTRSIVDAVKRLQKDNDVSVCNSLDERDPAVTALIAQAIQACRAQGKYIGICGQGPSDHPDFARWLLQQGIGSISLNPDTVIETWKQLAQ